MQSGTPFVIFLYVFSESSINNQQVIFVMLKRAIPKLCRINNCQTCFPSCGLANNFCKETVPMIPFVPVDDTIIHPILMLANLKFIHNWRPSTIFQSVESITTFWLIGLVTLSEVSSVNCFHQLNWKQRSSISVGFQIPLVKMLALVIWGQHVSCPLDSCWVAGNPSEFLWFI